MREIKFRAWNRSVNKMSYFGEPMVSSCETKDGHIWGMFLPSLEGKIYLSKYDDHIIQCTGLEDCSGAEIYEGDILEGFDNRFIVKSGNIKFKKVAPNGSINEVEMTCFYFEDMQGNPLFPIVNNYKGEHDMQSLRVIGNIYENPELLEEN